MADPPLPPDLRDYMVYLRELAAKDPAAAEQELAALWAADYDFTPVDMEKFCYDPYFLGFEGNNLFRTLFEQGMVPAFTPTPEGKPKIEVILGGAIGWGKTKLGAFMFCRILYELMCLRRPHIFHGVSVSTPIALVNLSVTGEQAERAFFAEVLTMLDNSPFFNEHCPIEYDDKSYRKYSHKNIHLVCGNSTELSAIGLAAVGAAIDEANFMISTKRSKKEVLANDLDHAMVLYRSLKNRINSRFMHSPRFPGKVILMSSAQYPDDFLEQHIKLVLADPQTAAQTVILQMAQWESRPKVMLQGVSYFRVAVGSGPILSKILTEAEPLPEGTTELKVPDIMTYRRDFETDLENSIREIAGRSTLAVTPFIQRRDLVYARSTSELAQTLAHPYPQWKTTLQDGQELIKEYIAEQVTRKVSYVDVLQRPRKAKESLWQPRRHPHRPRFIHVDLAINQCACGLAMGYAPRQVWRNQASRLMADGSQQTVNQYEAPFIVVELMMEIVAPPNGEIILGLVRGVIMDLRDLGFHLAKVTFDQFQSKDSQQILAGMGMVTDQQSVDRDSTAYDALKSAIYEDRIAYYPHPTFIREVCALQRDAKTHKIDHPPHGSKDVSDAVAGVVALIQEARADIPSADPVPSQGYMAPEATEDPAEIHKWLFD